MKKITRKSKPKTITVKLKFGAFRHCLWDSSCKNLIKEQPERFELLEGKPCKTGTMYFCITYLEAQVVMALEKGVGLYDDVINGNFVVCSKKPFKSLG